MTRKNLKFIINWRWYNPYMIFRDRNGFIFAFRGADNNLISKHCYMCNFEALISQPPIYVGQISSCNDLGEGSVRHSAVLTDFEEKVLLEVVGR